MKYSCRLIVPNHFQNNMTTEKSLRSECGFTHWQEVLKKGLCEI